MIYLKKYSFITLVIFLVCIFAFFIPRTASATHLGFQCVLNEHTDSACLQPVEFGSFSFCSSFNMLEACVFDGASNTFIDTACFSCDLFGAGFKCSDTTFRCVAPVPPTPIPPPPATPTIPPLPTATPRPPAPTPTPLPKPLCPANGTCRNDIDGCIIPVEKLDSNFRCTLASLICCMPISALTPTPIPTVGPSTPTIAPPTATPFPTNMPTPGPTSAPTPPPPTPTPVCVTDGDTCNDKSPCNTEPNCSNFVCHGLTLLRPGKCTDINTICSKATIPCNTDAQCKDGSQGCAKYSCIPSGLFKECRIPKPPQPPTPTPKLGLQCSDLDPITHKCRSVTTAIGNIEIDPAKFVSRIMSLVLGISGGIAVLLIILSGYSLMTSRDKPEQIQDARQRLLGAIAGLIFIALALTILEVIGVDVLQIPGFGH